MLLPTDFHYDRVSGKASVAATLSAPSAAPGTGAPAPPVIRQGQLISGAVTGEDVGIAEASIIKRLASTPYTQSDAARFLNDLLGLTKAYFMSEVSSMTLVDQMLDTSLRRKMAQELKDLETLEEKERQELAVRHQAEQVEQQLVRDSGGIRRVLRTVTVANERKHEIEREGLLLRQMLTRAATMNKTVNDWIEKRNFHLVPGSRNPYDRRAYSNHVYCKSKGTISASLPLCTPTFPALPYSPHIPTFPTPSTCRKTN